MIEHSSFSPEHEKAITVAFEDCLRALGLTDRPSDPAVLVIARRIIELAKQGECNPALLRMGHSSPSRPRGYTLEGDGVGIGWQLHTFYEYEGACFELSQGLYPGLRRPGTRPMRFPGFQVVRPEVAC